MKITKEEQEIIRKTNSSESSKKFLTLIKYYNRSIINDEEILSGILGIIRCHKVKDSYDALSVINITVILMLQYTDDLGVLKNG